MTEDLKILRKHVADAKRQYEDMRGTPYWGISHIQFKEAVDELEKAERKKK